MPISTSDAAWPLSVELVGAARVLARLARVVDKVCQDASLSLPQYRLLVWVEREPKRASELALRNSVSRPTLTSLVDGLERQGLMVRVPVDSDRRGIRLELTAAGTEALAAADRLLADRVSELITEAGVPELTAALGAVGETLDRQLEARLREASAS